MRERGFLGACLENRAEPSEIDDFISLWHRSDTDEPLSDFLGMTADEYGFWVERPESLDDILAAHRRSITVERVLEERVLQPGAAGHEAAGLLAWWRTRSERIGA